MPNFPGVQYIPGVGWVASGLGNVPTPSPYNQRPEGALAGEQDVMMISGLRGLGDGENGAVAQPSGFTSSPGTMLLIGLVLGLLLGSIVLANQIKE